ncbi:YadA-like family protein [Veillonella magna]|uniref:YadA-like family protein n=1 Tax=Veillonella magna TaxID=464322 RepID=UPI0026DB28A1|nr:YadA-like family protein [Veillonella magna]
MSISRAAMAALMCISVWSAAAVSSSWVEGASTDEVPVSVKYDETTGTIKIIKTDPNTNVETIVATYAVGGNISPITSIGTKNPTGIIAIGDQSKAVQSNTIAIGADAHAGNVGGSDDTNGRIAIGTKTVASGLRSIALGNYSTTNKGSYNIVQGSDSIGIGTSTSIFGYSGVSIGRRNIIGIPEPALVSSSGVLTTKRKTSYSEPDPGGNSVIVGAYNVAYGNRSSIIGTYSRAMGSNSVAIGSGVQSLSDGSIAIGKGSGYEFEDASRSAKSTDRDYYGRDWELPPEYKVLKQVLLTDIAGDGTDTRTSSRKNGYFEHREQPKYNNYGAGSSDPGGFIVEGKNALGIGTYTQVRGDSAIGLATGEMTADLSDKDKSAYARDMRKIMDMEETLYDAKEALQAGTGDTATLKSAVKAAEESLATAKKNFRETYLTKYSFVDGDGALGVGRQILAQGDRSMAVGDFAKAISSDAIAYGGQTLANGTNSMAIGGKAHVGTTDKSFDNSMAIGSHTDVQAGNAVALGAFSQVTGQNSLALGFGKQSGDAITYNRVSGKDSTLIGSYGNIAGNNSILIGSSGSIANDRVVGLGNNINIEAADPNDQENNTAGSVFLGDHAGYVKDSKRSRSLGQVDVVGSAGKMELTESLSSTKGALRDYTKDFIYIYMLEKQDDGTKIGPPIAVRSDFAGGDSTVGVVSVGSTYQQQFNSLEDIKDYHSKVGSLITVPVDVTVQVTKNGVPLGEQQQTRYFAADSTRDTIYADNTLSEEDKAKVWNTIQKSISSSNTTYTVFETRRIQNVAPGLIGLNSTDAINGSQLFATNQMLGNLVGSLKKTLGDNVTVTEDGEITVAGDIKTLGWIAKADMVDGSNGKVTYDVDKEKGETEEAYQARIAELKKDGYIVDASKVMTFKAGKNIELVQKPGEFSISTIDTPSFKSVELRGDETKDVDGNKVTPVTMLDSNGMQVYTETVTPDGDGTTTTKKVSTTVNNEGVTTDGTVKVTNGKDGDDAKDLVTIGKEVNSDAAPGTDGENGTIGLNGKNGSEAVITIDRGTKSLTDDKNIALDPTKPVGENNPMSMDRITYTTKGADGSTINHEVATLDDGFFLTTSKDVTDDKAAAKVKLNNTIKFTDGANTKVSTVDSEEGIHELHIDVSGLPVSYTDNDGDAVTKIGDKYYKSNQVVDGKPIDGATEVPADQVTNNIKLVNTDGTTNTPGTISNVASGIGGKVVDPDHNDSNTFLENVNKVGATTDGISENVVVNAKDLKNLVDTGFKLNTSGQPTDSGATTVKIGETINIIDGANTKVSAIDDSTTTGTHTFHIDVTGMPISYTDNQGNALTKIGDNYYKNTDIEDGKPKDNAVAVPADKVTNNVKVVNKDGGTTKQGSIGNVKSVFDSTIGNGGDTGSQIDDINDANKVEKVPGTNQFIKDLTTLKGDTPADKEKLNSVSTVGDLQKVALTPLFFEGDTADGKTGTDGKPHKNTFGRKLSETAKIIGGQTDVTKLTDGNIGVVSNGSDTLTIKLAKELTDLTSVTAGSGDNTMTMTAGGTTTTSKVDDIVKTISTTPNGMTTTEQKVDTTGTPTGESKTTMVTPDGVTVTTGTTDGQTIKTALDKDGLATDGKVVVTNGKDGDAGKKLVTIDKVVDANAPAGTDGEHGQIGLDGKNGSEATITIDRGTKSLADGKNIALDPTKPVGENNPMSMDRITYTTKGADGSTINHEVATLDDGFFLTTSKDVTDDKAAAKVKLNNTIKFTDGANTKVSTVDSEEGIHELHIDVSGLPVSYTDNDGDAVTKIGDKYYKSNQVVDGKPIDGATEVPADQVTNNIKLVNTDGTTNTPGTISNVASGIGGKVVDPDHNDSNTFLENVNKVGATTDGISENVVVNAKDLKNLVDTGFKLNTSGQPTDSGATTVKIGETINVVNGVNTKVSAIDDTVEGTHTFHIDVTGMPMSYVDNQGKSLTKIGDTFYRTEELVDGKPPAGAKGVPDTEVTSNVTMLDKNGKNVEAPQIKNVGSGLVNSNNKAMNPSDLLNTADNDPVLKNAVNAGDLKQVAAAVKTEVTGTGKAIVTQTEGDKGQAIYNVHVDPVIDVVGADGSKVVRGGDGKYYNPTAIQGKTFVSNGQGGGSWYNDDDVVNGVPTENATPQVVEPADVKNSFVNPNSNESIVVDNVKSGIGGEVQDPSKNKANTFLENVNKVGATTDGISENVVVNAKDLKNLVDTGFKLNTSGQPTDSGATTVKIGETINVVNGVNTKVSAIDDTVEGTHTFHIDVTGMPMSYVDNQGKSLTKIGDTFYRTEELVDGKPPAGAKGVPDTEVTSNVTMLDKNGKNVEAPQIKNVGSGLVNSNNKAMNPSDLLNTADNDPVLKNAVNAGDLKQVAAAVKTEVTGTGKAIVTQTEGDKGQAIYNVHVDPVIDVVGADGSKVVRGGDGKYYNPTAIQGKTFVSNGQGGGSWYNDDDVVNGVPTENATPQVVEPADVKNSFVNPNSNESIVVDNVKSGIGGEVQDPSKNKANTFLENVNKVGATTDGISENTVVNAKDLKNVVDTGFKLNTSGQGTNPADTVKIGDTIQVVDGKNTTVSAITHPSTGVHKFHIDVTGLPVTYTATETDGEGKPTGTPVDVTKTKDGYQKADGTPLIKINENGKDVYYTADQLDNNVPKPGAKGLTITDNIRLINPKDGIGATKITNVAAGTDDTDAVNVSQLKEMAAGASTEVTGTGKAIVTSKKGDAGQTVYNVHVDPVVEVQSKDGSEVTRGGDGKYYKSRDIADKVYVPNADGNGGNWYNKTDVTDGKPNTGANPQTPVALKQSDIKTSLVNPNAGVDSTSMDNSIILDNVKSGIGGDAGNNGIPKDSTIDGTTGDNSFIKNLDTVGKAGGIDKNTVVNAGDLKNLADTPLFFSGDSADGVVAADGTDKNTFSRKLSQETKIVGGVNLELQDGATAEQRKEAIAAKLTDGNIGVISDGTDTLTIKLAKELKDLDSVKVSNGKDGKDGKNLVTIGKEVDDKAPDGKDGENGIIGLDGKNGSEAVITIDRGTKSITDEANLGENPSQLVSGTNKSAKMDRITYTTKGANGDINHEVATLDDGFMLTTSTDVANSKAPANVKLNNTIKFTDGANTKVSTVDSKDGIHELHVDVTGLPMTYTATKTDAKGNVVGDPVSVSKVGDTYQDAAGNKLIKVGDKYYRPDQLVDSNVPNPEVKDAEKANGLTITDSISLVNNNGKTIPTTLKNVGSGLKDANGNPTSIDKAVGSNAVNVDDLRTIGKAATTEVIGTGAAEVTKVTGANGQNIYNVHVDKLMTVKPVDANTKIARGGDGKYYNADDIAGKTFVSDGHGGGNWYDANDVDQTTGKPKTEDDGITPKQPLKDQPQKVDQNMLKNSVVNPNGDEATILDNVKSGIGGKVVDPEHENKNTFMENVDTIGKANGISENTVVNAGDLKNLVDTGFKLNTSGHSGNAQTVKIGETIKVVDGANTRVSDITSKDGVHEFHIDVTGLPMTYTVSQTGDAGTSESVSKVGDTYQLADGTKLVKVGDKFYKPSQLVDPKADQPQVRPEEVDKNWTVNDSISLVNKDGSDNAPTLKNVGSGLKDAAGKSTSIDKAVGSNAVNVDDLRTIGKAATTEVTGTGAAEVTKVTGANGQNIYNVHVDKLMTVKPVDANTKIARGGDGKYYNADDIAGKTFVSDGHGGGNWYDANDVDQTTGKPKTEDDGITPKQPLKDQPQKVDQNMLKNSVVNPNGDEATILDNVKSGIGGKVVDPEHENKNTFMKNVDTIGKANGISENTVVNAGDLKNLVDTGFKLNTSGHSGDAQTVKIGDTINIIDGANTKVSAIDDSTTGTHTFHIDVTGLPVTYTATKTDANGAPMGEPVDVSKVGDGYQLADGTKLVKAGDKYYTPDQLENGKPKPDAKGLTIKESVSLTQDNSAPATLERVGSGRRNGMDASEKPMDWNTILNPTGENEDKVNKMLTNAANIGDVRDAMQSVTEAGKGGGFGLTGNNGTVTQDLGKTITVKGGIANKVDEAGQDLHVPEKSTTDQNTYVNAKDVPNADGNGTHKEMVVEIAKDLTDLDSVTVGSVDENGNGGTVINKDGMTVKDATGNNSTSIGTGTIGTSKTDKDGNTSSTNIDGGTITSEKKDKDGNKQSTTIDGSHITLENKDKDGKLTGPKTEVSNEGMTITPVDKDGNAVTDPKKQVSITDKGLNNGGNQIINVDSGLKDTNGSVKLKDATGDMLNNAVNVGDLKEAINNAQTAVDGDGAAEISKSVDDNGRPTYKVHVDKLVEAKADDGKAIVRGEDNKFYYKDESLKQGKDGKWYPKDKLDADGNPEAGVVGKNIPILGTDPVPADNLKTSLVNPNDPNSKVKLDNIKSTIGGDVGNGAGSEDKVNGADGTNSFIDNLDKVGKKDADGNSDPNGIADDAAVTTGDLKNLADTPLFFGGDSADGESTDGKEHTNTFDRKLGKQINIKGEVDLGLGDNATAEERKAAIKKKLSDGNIGVISNGKDTLTVKLSKDLKDLSTIEVNDSVSVGKDGDSTVIKGSETTSSFTEVATGPDGQPLYEVDKNGEVVRDANGDPIPVTKTSSTTTKGGTVTIKDSNVATGPDGKPLYKVDENGNPVLDEKGHKIPITESSSTTTGGGKLATDVEKVKMVDGKPVTSHETTTIDGSHFESKDKDGNYTTINGGEIKSYDKDTNGSVTIKGDSLTASSKDENGHDKVTNISSDGFNSTATTFERDGNGQLVLDPDTGLPKEVTNKTNINADGFTATRTDSEGNEVLKTTMQNGNIAIEKPQPIIDPTTGEAYKVLDKNGNWVPAHGYTKISDNGFEIQGINQSGTGISKVRLSSEGLDNGGNRITHVAEGVAPDDAVNVSQLRGLTQNINNDIANVGANAAALAGLKAIQYDPLEPTQIMAAVGTYRGKQAAALGIAHYKNEDTMFHMGVSIGSDHTMANIGVTYKFGRTDEKKAVPDRYKAGPISSTYVLQDEMVALKEENARMRANDEKMNAAYDEILNLVKQLKQDNEEMKKKLEKLEKK